MSNVKTMQPVKLSLKFKITWGIASLGGNMIAGIFGALLPIFYQDYLGLTAKWITLASLIYGIWNAINDPVFGFLSDNTRSKKGRRIPFMRYTAPFLALSFILVWLAPEQAKDVWLFVWMLVSMILYDGCYTLIMLVYSALLPEVSESDTERNHLQISSSLFGMVGMLLGFLIPDFFRPKTGSDPSFLPLQIAMVVVGITCMLLILVTTYNVKERLEFTKVDKPLGIWEQVKATFSSKSFLVLVAQNFMSILVSSLVTGSMYYLADYVMQTSTIVLLIYIFVPMLIGIPVTNIIRKKVGVLKAQQILLVISGVGLCALTFLPNSLVPVALVLAGFGLSGPQTLTNILFAQVADEDEIRTGVRREGAFFGINALVTKPAQSVALALTPWILELTHFATRKSNEGQAVLDQPLSAVFGIKLFMGLIPGVAMLLGALILFLFPLKGKYLEDVQAKVLEMHAQKHEELEKMAQ
jgi:glycoside/pentoside/hexuronide:cation symporter, GPH family